MNSMDAHGILKSALLRGNYAARKSGTRIAFRCPEHNDSTASAWLGDHAWGCSACGFSRGLSSLAEKLGVELPAEATGNGLTLAEYADRKGLSLAVLARAGVRDGTGKYGGSVVEIPYYGPDKALLRTKVRTRKGTFWNPDGTGTPLYGQWMLSELQGPVVLVEGESDCHAAWQRGVCAVGLPGASNWKPEFAPLLNGRDVIVWQEPDEGGATMVAKVSTSLPKAKVLREVTYNGTVMKDLCELHQAVAASGEAWGPAWRTIVESATPIGAESSVVAFDSLTSSTLEHLLQEKLAPIDAVPTMLAKWNEACNGGGGGVGLARGWYITIGANTGTGKTLIGLNLAAHAAQHGETVTFISLEMGRSELATRCMSIVSGESTTVLEQGAMFNPDAFRRAQRAMDTMKERSGGEILMNRRPISRLQDVVSCVKHHVETFGSKYFIIDYIQLIWTANAHSIHERMELVSHQLRELTHVNNIVMVTLSQFNRQTSALRAERPVAQGLMGGSALENDSHQVLLFDHSRFTRSGNLADTWLLIDKNRHGPVTDLPVQWDYRTLRLSERLPSIREAEAHHGTMLPKWRDRN